MLSVAASAVVAAPKPAKGMKREINDARTSSSYPLAALGSAAVSDPGYSGNAANLYATRDNYADGTAYGSYYVSRQSTLYKIIALT